MADLMVIAVVLAVVSSAGLYVYRAKKAGVKCIGCPDGGSCSGGCAGCSGSCHGSGN